MALDWKSLTATLREECDLMAQLASALERERIALADIDLAGLTEASAAKDTLVPRLESVQERRRDVMAEGEGKGLRSLAAVAPAGEAKDLRSLGRRAADLAEQVFLLNRGNSQLLLQGRDFLKNRMDGLRFRDGRVVLYGRRTDSVSIGGASIIQRDL